MDYSALFNAVTGTQAPGLSPQQIQENYNAFQELQKQGITIPTLMRDLEDLKAKVSAIETKPKTPQLDSELFQVMEAAVKDDPQVVSARMNAQQVKAQIISELCRQDPRYAQALDQYSREVHAAYVRRTESRVLDLETPDRLTDS